jgi:hypothetical protein
MEAGVWLAVVGSRGFTDYQKLTNTLDEFRSKHPIKGIISGGARGADSLAQRYAEERNIRTQIFLPDWDKHGKIAGILRNQDIVDACNVLIAFWDGKSRGTKDSINKAKKKGKEVFVIGCP